MRENWADATGRAQSSQNCARYPGKDGEDDSVEKLKLIQCGVGGFGQSWLSEVTAASPDFELVAIVDVQAANLASAGDTAGIPAERRFTTLEEALDKVQADAVLTVTPPQVHIQHARLAFERGLH